MTNDTKRTAIWEAYTDADTKHRYFLLLKDKYKKRIFYISLAIGLCASGSLIQLSLETKIPYLLNGVSLLASALGIYLSSSDITKKLATATTAAQTWSRAHNEYKRIWELTESGKDVWRQHVQLDKSLELIDVEVINNLETHDALIDKAEQDMRNALNIAT